jgi:hypothetical protein
MNNDFRVNEDDLLADRLVEEELAPVVPIDEPEINPNKFKTLTGDKIKLTSADCGNHSLAQIIVKVWENNVAARGTLSAADLNNIGCAYVWLAEPDYPKAKGLFGRALQKDPGNQTIMENISLIP